MLRRKPAQRRRRPDDSLSLESKWGWQPCVEQGFCSVPACLLRNAAALGISAEEGWLLVQLLDLKWSSQETTLAGLSDRCLFGEDGILERLRQLQARGFLKLIPKYLPQKVAVAENGGSYEPGSRIQCGWEIDLSSLLQALNEYVMRDGDLTSGFLHLSSIRVEKD